MQQLKSVPTPIRIGTSGWSYPKGRGTWNGVFYPASAPRGKKVDELAYYAEHFDTVEVNSTFYRLPAPGVSAGWAKRTPRDFEFAVKLYQQFTHPAMFARSGAAAAQGGEVDLSVGQEDIDAMRMALDPLASAGKLGPVLAQFPPSFKADAASWDYLPWLLRAFAEYPLAIELRHRSWSDEHERVEALLAEFDAAWVRIDEPKFRFSIARDLRPNISAFFYMRLHGRNAGQWWTHEASEDRYNYLYSEQELEPFTQAATAARRLVKKLYLYMNNHFESKAVANAVMLKSKLGLAIEGTYPESFLERFPALRGVVTPDPPPPGRLL